MEKIDSFKINHLTLERGLYVSRRDSLNGCDTTTFDLRFTLPNRESVMDTGAIHTIEHLGATYLRNSECAHNIIYFGPMGCRTGFYLVAFNRLESSDVYKMIVDMCEFIINFEGEIPGATPIECGNWSEQNLALAKEYTKRYKLDLETHKNFVYSVK